MPRARLSSHLVRRLPRRVFDDVNCCAPGVLVTTVLLGVRGDRCVERGLNDRGPVGAHRLGDVHLAPQVDQQRALEVEGQARLVPVGEEPFVHELAVHTDEEVPPELVVVVVDEIEELDRAQACRGFEAPQAVGDRERESESRRRASPSRRVPVLLGQLALVHVRASKVRAVASPRRRGCSLSTSRTGEPQMLHGSFIGVPPVGSLLKGRYAEVPTIPWRAIGLRFSDRLSRAAGVEPTSDPVRACSVKLE